MPRTAHGETTGAVLARRFVLVGAWGSLAVVTALCVVDGWLTLVGDLEDLWFTVGDLASFWSTDLMLLEMIFAAKIPAVERLFTEGSARTRRSFGAGSLIALMVCVLATVAGYTQEEPETLWLNVVDTVMGLPLTLVVMVVALAVVSTIAVITTVRRRSVQEIQDLIGRWVFPVCLLMVPFDLWVDADLLSSPWTNAYWWTLWLVTVVVSVVFRGGVSEAPGAVAGPARGRGARAERPGPQEMFALRPRPTNTPSG